MLRRFPAHNSKTCQLILMCRSTCINSRSSLVNRIANAEPFWKLYNLPIDKIKSKISKYIACYRLLFILRIIIWLGNIKMRVCVSLMAIYMMILFFIFFVIFVVVSFLFVSEIRKSQYFNFECSALLWLKQTNWSKRCPSSTSFIFQVSLHRQDHFAFKFMVSDIIY